MLSPICFVPARMAKEKRRPEPITSAQGFQLISSQIQSRCKDKDEEEESELFVGDCVRGMAALFINMPDFAGTFQTVIYIR